MSTDLDFEQVIKESFDETNSALQVRGVGGTLVSEKFDKVDATYPDAITEVYSYSLGGVGVGVVTVIYTDATKADLSSVTRT